MTFATRRAVLSGAMAASVVLAGGGSAAARGRWAPKSIQVVSRPLDGFALLDSGLRRFGSLEFMGGLDLRADDDHFGGFSGLAMYPDGQRFLALSDHGVWLQGRLTLAGDRPSSISDAVMAPMLDADGLPLADTRAHDTEALALVDGLAYVGIERVHAVMRFPVGRDGLIARGQVIPVPAAAKTLSPNQGLEAIGILPAGPLAGSLIAIAERSGKGDTAPTKGFFVQPQREGFQVARSNDYSITDLAFLPDGGDMLLLERRFSWMSGVSMRIRRIDLRSIRPGALLDGPVLIEAGMHFRIDNMEGLSVHRAAGGDTVLTLISDDNFSPLQRTIMLRFRLLPDA
jgi:hypothetical protein